MERTFWDSSLLVSLTLWDTPVLFTPPLPLPQHMSYFHMFCSLPSTLGTGVVQVVNLDWCKFQCRAMSEGHDGLCNKTMKQHLNCGRTSVGKVWIC